MKFMSANRIAPDGMSHFAASHPGLFCLPMSHKKDAMLISVKLFNINFFSRKCTFINLETSNLCRIKLHFFKMKYTIEVQVQDISSLHSV